MFPGLNLAYHANHALVHSTMTGFDPMFFEGKQGNSLYGVYHYPESDASGQQGVVLLPPFGQEGVRVHKTLQKLASDLAKLGFYVLRFDYSGTGNSEESQNAGLKTWIEDANSALDRLHELSGAVNLSLVGVRLGATIALCLQRHLHSVALWDPIGDGAAYLAELRELHQTIFTSQLYFRKPPSPKDQSELEYLGHRIDPTLRESLQTFALESSIATKADNLLWIEAEKSPASASFERSFGQLGQNAQRQNVPLQCHWNSIEQLENMLLGQPVARVITHFLRDTTD